MMKQSKDKKGYRRAAHFYWGKDRYKLNFILNEVIFCFSIKSIKTLFLLMISRFLMTSHTEQKFLEVDLEFKKGLIFIEFN